MIAPVSLICMSTHEASATRLLLKPPSHIWATCYPGIARDPFKKARPERALHYHDYQLPDHLYISPRVTSIKGIRQYQEIVDITAHYDINSGTSNRSQSIIVRCKQTLKPCSHITCVFAFSSNVRNGFYGNKWWCLHLTFAAKMKENANADVICGSSFPVIHKSDNIGIMEINWK